MSWFKTRFPSRCLRPRNVRLGTAVAVLVTANVTALAQVQVELDLAPVQKVLGYGNVGNEGLDLLDIGTSTVDGIEIVVASATDHGLGCPTPDPLRIDTRPVGTTDWTLEASLDPRADARAQGSAVAFLSSSSVALSQDILVGGSHLGRVGNLGDGVALVYRRRGGAWDLEAVLQASDPEPWDDFGWAVAVNRSFINGTWIAVGAPNEGSGANPPSFQGGIGAAYVFEHSLIDTWTEIAKLTPADGDIGDRFGEAVAVHRDARTVLVGAPDHSTVGFNTAGVAYLFQRGLKTENWALLDKFLENTDPDPVTSGGDFGRSVALGYTDAVIGDVGKVHFYAADPTEPDGTVWFHVQTNLSPEEGSGAFGRSVDVGLFPNSNVAGAVVGDPFADTSAPDAGAVYVYRRVVPTFWIQDGRLTPPSVQTGDGFADTVAFDGLVAAGAPFHDGAGQNAGAVFTYQHDDAVGAWQPDAPIVEGEPTPGELFGSAVAIDGNTMIVGVPKGVGCGTCNCLPGIRGQQLRS